MTDAREIIARYLCEMAAQGWADISPFERASYRTTAHEMVNAVTAAGFRIIGPDDVDPVTVVRPLDDWHEDYGDAVWWTWTGRDWLGEPSYIGGPNDSDWPGYHTHWSPHPAFPRAIGRKA